MKLRDFIKDTMTEIAHGIQAAKIGTADLWAISPGLLHGERLIEKSYVEFDVAVTVNEMNGSERDGKRDKGRNRGPWLSCRRGAVWRGGRKEGDVHCEC